MTSRVPLGQMLVQQGRLDPYQLQSALAHQRRWGGRIGEAIVALGFLSEPEVLEVVARQLGVPFVRLGMRRVDDAVLRRVPERLVRARRVFPLGILERTRRGALVVATTEPQNLHVLDEVAFASGLVVRPVLASASDVDHAIERHYGAPAGTPVEVPTAAAAPLRVVPVAQLG